MTRKTTGSAKTTAAKTAPAKGAAKKTAAKKGAKGAKKTTAKKTTPRRSHSHFTSVSDALLMSDSRPSSIEWNEKRGQYLVRDKGGKIVARCNSMSAARRARYKVDAAAKFAPTAKQVASARAKRDKDNG